MAHPPVLEVRSLSKRYPVSPEAYGASAIRRWWRRREAAVDDDAAFVWALRDITFDVFEGERVGIIGRNGAGKSTLLKVLSRVTHPTSGRAVIRGRVTSLLEVGTGFNDDLSGRENIYLNAALHGLDRDEIDARYADIVAFAELARFIDAPVKTYSSGMRMRLAFAVAAHLDPDILMLDEILAVGDMSFQRKCLARMNELTGEGRTLLFVSHSMDAVARFCDRCIWLEAGRIRGEGAVEAVVGSYLERVLGVRPAIAVSHEQDLGCGDETASVGGFAADELRSRVARLGAARVLDAAGRVATTVRVDEPITIEIEYEIVAEHGVIEPALHVRTRDQTLAFVAAYTDDSRPSGNRAAGWYRTRAEIPANLLNIGVYYISVALVTPDPMERHLTVENAISFNVHESAAGSGSARGRYGRSFPGPVRPRLVWRTEFRERAVAPDRVVGASNS